MAQFYTYKAHLHYYIIYLMIHKMMMIHIAISYLEECCYVCSGPDSPVKVDVVRVVPARHAVMVTPTLVQIVVVLVLGVRGLPVTSAPRLHLLLRHTNCVHNPLKKLPQSHFTLFPILIFFMSRIHQLCKLTWHHPSRLSTMFEILLDSTASSLSLKTLASLKVKH